MTILYDCSAANIDRDVCIERPFLFASGRKACRFTLVDAQRWFDSDMGVCPQKCRIKIKYLYDGYGYQLTNIDLNFNGLSDYFATRCNNLNFERTLEIVCKIDTENGISKDICTPTKECEEESKTCLLTGNIGICICKSGYIGCQNECLKGNLKLNETCEQNEQCSGAFGSVCQNNTCVCRPGYVPLNDSECIMLHPGVNSQASIQDQTEDKIGGVTVGSLFGGLILGVFLTIFAVTLFHQMRHGKFKRKEKECPKVTTFNNISYEAEKNADQNIPSMHCTNERKIVNVSPFAHSTESSTKKCAQETRTQSMANNYKNNGVYNHLYEKEEDMEIDKHYDYANRNPTRAMKESNYCVLSTERRHEGADVCVAEDCDAQVPANVYCSLEKQ
ncbi:uncharacterized protein LOC133176564 [Saccostrea echinata]|uniref:uncharacterized protein LOC133176564 n=1 Tax=Saccostrea echinata TaxID=191078 RepID=UPI002A831A65|nr:uncharacterized protein LOC133176564 [Saccostrea echinata]